MKKSIKEEYEYLFNKYTTLREMKIEDEKGNVHPKDIDPPSIGLIQYPEPHVIITD